jgi:hypothetical protein
VKARQTTEPRSFGQSYKPAIGKIGKQAVGKRAISHGRHPIIACRISRPRFRALRFREYSLNVQPQETPMSKDQDKTKPGQKENPGKGKQNVDPTELTDDVLDKVSGGTGSPSADSNSDLFKIFKTNIK